jgi:hypothetical protein
VVGGLGLLGWHHGSLEMAIHIVAGLSVLGGGAAVASAFPKAKALAKSGGQEVVSMRGYLNQSIKAPSFGFTQLNSRSLPVARKLDRIATGGSQALPAGLAAKFKRADAAAKAAKKEAVAVRVAEIDALADELLEGGVDPAEIYQRCFPRTYVVSFEDPPRRQQRRPQSHSTASAVAQFSGLVSLLVDVASKHDEVVIKMTSPGGGVSEYGQLAMQVLRLRKAGITTTVCIDTVAASGGYMAACVADKVFASPFAFVGSIGVVAEMPNVSKVLKKQNVDWMREWCQPSCHTDLSRLLCSAPFNMHAQKTALNGIWHSTSWLDCGHTVLNRLARSFIECVEFEPNGLARPPVCVRAAARGVD